ncbi:MAG: hypothetical protein Q4Q07_05310 [Tissierellia bacterium]|nr:hypothetical protein [Tissierellia bacterium]
MFIFFILLLLISFYLFYSLREPQEISVNPQKLNLDPAMLNFLFEGYKSPHLSIIGFIKELEAQGILNEEYNFIRDPKDIRGKILKDLFQEQSLKKHISLDDEKRDIFLREWYESIKKDLEVGGYVIESSFHLQNLYPIVLGIICSILSLILLSKSYYLGVIPLICNLLYLFLAIKKIGKLPEKGEKILKLWSDKKTSSHWEKKEIPYAIALGKYPIEPELEYIQELFFGNILHKK